MKRILRFLTSAAFIFHFLSSCGQISNSKVNPESKVNLQTIDTSQYAIIQYDTKDTLLFKNVRATTLTQSEVEETDILLKKCIDNYNPEQQSQFDSISKTHPEYNLKIQNFVIDLSKYKRQYFPVVNSTGQKEVWINCFCNDFEKNWKNEMLIVADGGNCFFNLVINLTTNSYYRFIVNGDA